MALCVRYVVKTPSENAKSSERSGGNVSNAASVKTHVVLSFKFSRATASAAGLASKDANERRAAQPSSPSGQSHIQHQRRAPPKAIGATKYTEVVFENCFALLATRLVSSWRNVDPPCQSPGQLGCRHFVEPTCMLRLCSSVPRAAPPKLHKPCCCPAAKRAFSRAGYL